MNDRSIEGAEKAAKAVLAYKSPRSRKLEMLERWADGTQYEGLPDWFDDACEKPIWERAPCIVYPVVKTAASSNVDLVLGEGRFPAISSMPDEDDEEADGGLAGDEESEAVDRFLADLVARSRFKPVSRQALYAAQTTGSVAAVIGVRRGRPFIDMVPAKWCEPELDDEGKVTKLVIEYPYVETTKVNGKWTSVAKLFRRVIDDKQDVTMLPADATEAGTEPSWVADPKRTVKHGLGFCPVVWYAFMKPCTTVHTVDGEAIQAHCLDEIRAHDFALSQRHRSALFLGDPQIVETGVEQGYQPAASGRTASLPTTMAGGVPKSAAEVRGQFITAGPKKARKKGPGVVWTYENPDAKVSYLSLSGDALKPIDEHAADLRNKVAESLFVVFLDPENIKFAATTSGKALETLRERQLSRCDMIRDDFGDGFIMPVLGMLVRVVTTVAPKARVKVTNADVVASMADDFSQDGEWVGPALSLRWGPYFRSDVDEETKTVAMVQAARMGGLITRRMATEKLKSAFAIENVDLATDAIASEAADASKEAETATLVKMLAVPSVTFRKALYKRLARATVPGLEESELATIDREIDSGVTEKDLEPKEPAETPNDPTAPKDRPE